MTVHGHSFAEYADIFSRMSLENADYLALRDMPDLLRNYAKGKKALDYGCGLGKSTTFLRKFDFSIDGVDVSEPMIDLARKTLPDVNFYVLQDGKIPAEDEHYDLVFCSWVLQDIGPKKNLTMAISEIARVLKNEGVFVAVVSSEAFYSKEWIHANAEFEENKNLKSGDKTKILVKGSDNFYWRDYFWTEKDYREVLRKAGLDVILVHYPLGTENDGIAWLNEKEVAPNAIYIAKKNN